VSVHDPLMHDLSYHTQSVSLWHASSKDRPRIDAFVVHGVTIIFVFASGMWVWTRCAKSVLASTSLGRRQGTEIDTAVAVCVALLEHPYAFLAIREYRDERRQQSKRKASAKVRKQTNRSSLLLAWIV
jgi:hypothetical protein